MRSRWHSRTISILRSLASICRSQIQISCALNLERPCAVSRLAWCKEHRAEESEVLAAALPARELVEHRVAPAERAPAPQAWYSPLSASALQSIPTIQSFRVA